MVVRAAARLGLVPVAIFLLVSCGFSDGIPQSEAGGLEGVPTYTLVPLQGVTPAELDAERAARRTIPFFDGHVRSPLDGKTYAFQIAGKPPGKSDETTTVPYVAIFLAVHYPDGTVLDPRQPACGDTISVEQRFLGGPNIVPVRTISNGVDVGTVQLGDGFQRAEFWHILRHTPRYHTVLGAGGPPITVSVNAPPSSKTFKGVCPGAAHRIGEIPIAEFEALVHRVIERHATSTQAAIVLAYNTFQVGRYGNCCINGFHGAFKRPSGVQTFAAATYNDAGAIRYYEQIADINAVTHEIGELLNDPFALPNGRANMAPAWGHVGQYSNGCSPFFEVGDPLDATAYPLKGRGFVYHPQELAFFSWFFRTKPIGTGRKYSFKGTFTMTQGLCSG